VAPYRETTGTEVLRAPTRDGVARLEVAPRYLVLEVGSQARLTITDRYLTLAQASRRNKKPRSVTLGDTRLLIARAVPTEEVGIWYESKPGVMHRVFSLIPIELMDDEALAAWRALEQLYHRLQRAVGPHLHRSVRASEYGRGPDRVLVEDQGDRDVVYVRPLFRERPRRVMDVHGDGTVTFVGKQGEHAVKCQSRFGVTVHGDHINFSDQRGITRGHIWLPWISEEDRKALALRFGDRVDQR
jgi:hypothetical protein